MRAIVTIITVLYLDITQVLRLSLTVGRQGGHTVGTPHGEEKLEK